MLKRLYSILRIYSLNSSEYYAHVCRKIGNLICLFILFTFTPAESSTLFNFSERHILSCHLIQVWSYLELAAARCGRSPWPSQSPRRRPAPPPPSGTSWPGRTHSSGGTSRTAAGKYTLFYFGWVDARPPSSQVYTVPWIRPSSMTGTSNTVTWSAAGWGWLRGRWLCRRSSS